MKEQYKAIVLQFLATLVCLVTFAPFAHAVTYTTPLDYCPGVIVVPEGYQLTRNTTCARFGWNESNKLFNLNGFILTVSDFALVGDRLTMRNGTIRIDGDFRAFGKTGTLSNLIITSAGSTLNNLFGLEAGTDFTIKNCTFSNFLANALTFYYGGGGGSVRNSVFIGNKTAISIQYTDGVLIENNTFVSNGRGVNLYDEDSGGVNNNTIRYNIFQNNGVGINMFAHAAGYLDYPSLQGNRFIGNQVGNSSRSGMFIEVTCSQKNECSGQDTLVSRNQFNHNGFSSDTGELDDDDGVFAQAYFTSGEAYPPGLAGVTLTKNRAKKNADLGFDVNGVTDGGGDTAKANGNPAQCEGVVCGRRSKSFEAISLKSLQTMLKSIQLRSINEVPLPSDQIIHHVKRR